MDNTCSVECCSGGWSGYAGSAVVMVLLRSHPHCGPWSTGNHTTDSYNWSQLLLNHCCLGLLGAKSRTKVNKTWAEIQILSCIISIMIIKANKHEVTSTTNNKRRLIYLGRSFIFALSRYNLPAVPNIILLPRSNTSSLPWLVLERLDG